MNTEFMAMIEQRLDALESKVKALEGAVTQIPQITMQPDPSRLAVVVTPDALTGL